MIAKTHLTLVLPGMAGILSQEINRNELSQSLSTILKKAKFQPKINSLSRLLFDHFSQQPLLNSDLPVVNLSGITELAIRADPCYLHADRDKLLLFSQGLTLSDEDVVELIGEVQPLLEDMGASLTAQTNTQWLLSLDQPTDVAFTAIDDVEGQSVDAYLPTGNQRGEWLRLWNEIQMQLYNSDINQRRIEQHKLPINSLWFWGAGEFEPSVSKWTSVRGDSSLLDQLIMATNSPKVDKDSPYVAGQHLWLVDSIDTDSDWQNQLAQYEESLFKPIVKQLSRTGITELTIDVPLLGRYHLNSLDYWKFWS